MAGRQHEPVAVGPARVGGVEFVEAGPQHGGDVGHAHRHAGMAGLRRLHRVDGQRADGVRHAPALRSWRAARGFRLAERGRGCRSTTRPRRSHGGPCPGVALAHALWRPAAYTGSRMCPGTGKPHGGSGVRRTHAPRRGVSPAPGWPAPAPPRTAPGSRPRPPPARCSPPRCATARPCTG